jgi:hypothetical protein
MYLENHKGTWSVWANGRQLPGEWLTREEAEAAVERLLSEGYLP